MRGRANYFFMIQDDNNCWNDDESLQHNLHVKMRRKIRIFNFNGLQAEERTNIIKKVVV